MFETSAAGTTLSRRLFVAAMRELGWIESRNIAYDMVHADGEPGRLPALAAALAARRPDVIFTITTEPLEALLAATRTVPVVMGSFNDPADFGIQSLAHPAGNVTGVTNFGIQLGAKRLQLLRQALPKVSRVVVLIQAQRPAAAKELKLIEEAAPALGFTVAPVPMTQSTDLNAALATIKGSPPQALLTTHSNLFLAEHARVLGSAGARRIPLVGHRSELAQLGALMSYSSILAEQIRRSAELVDKILKGARPAELPIEQPTRFELVVNLKTATALGLTLPQPFLARADRVIE